MADHKGFAFQTTVRNIDRLTDLRTTIPALVNETMEILKVQHESTIESMRNRENPVAGVMARFSESYGRGQTSQFKQNIVACVTGHRLWPILRKRKA